MRDFRLLPTGEWVVQCASPKDASKAFYALHDDAALCIGLRDVSVHAAHASKVQQAQESEASLQGGGGRSVSLVGLPFSADEDAVRRFLRGFEADIDRVSLLNDPDGRFSPVPLPYWTCCPYMSYPTGTWATVDGRFPKIFLPDLDREVMFVPVAPNTVAVVPNSSLRPLRVDEVLVLGLPIIFYYS